MDGWDDDDLQIDDLDDERMRGFEKKFVFLQKQLPGRKYT